MMMLLARLIFVVLGFVHVSAAFPILENKPSRPQGDSFHIHQIANPRFKSKWGPAAYARAKAKYPRDTKRVSKLGRRAVVSSSVTASPQWDDVDYLCPVTIGQQSQQVFLMDFDTGSSDLWVYGITSNAGSSHTVYKPGSSAKLVSGQSWTISYGDGSSAGGIVYQDTVTIGKTTVTDQAVEAAATVSSQFTARSGDGLVGLAFSTLNAVTPTAQKTFFDNAVAQGLPNLFAADLRINKPGRYDFGTLAPGYTASDIAYTPVDSSQGFWMFTPTAVSIGDNTTAIGSNPPAPGIADTGTSIMLLDKQVVTSYYAQVPGAHYSTADQGYVFPCDAKLPSFVVTISKKHRAVVPGSWLNFSPGSASGSCFGGMQVKTSAFSVYGDLFLKSQYVVFDRTTGSPRLGFANKDSSLSSKVKKRLLKLRLAYPR